MRTRAPIFDQLVEDSPGAPICTICGGVTLHPDGVCRFCWECDRDAQPELWHCADCGVFLEPFDRMVLVARYVERSPDDVFAVLVYLCGEHYWQRKHEDMLYRAA